MESFLQRFGALVLGVLHGFDHLRFRGSKRLLCFSSGVSHFLWKARVLLADYKEHYARETTATLCRSIETAAQEAGVYRYLNNSKASKEEVALQMAAEQGRREGLIAVLSCVEPGQFVQVRGNPVTKKLEPRIEWGKCLHDYHDYLDPDYGLRYTRLQSWPGEVRTSIKELVTGTRVKYHVQHNLLKMYDQFGQVLRLENLLLNARGFQVFRRREGDPDGPMEYLPLRKGVADLHRRAELGQQINERYAEALATVEEKTPLAALTADLGQRTTWKGRPARALNPLAPADVALLEAVNRGEFVLNGFRNRDLRALLFAATPATTPAEAKRQSAKVTRLLRLLRAHGVINKVPKTHRYQVSTKGRAKLTALLAARQANTQELLKAA